MIGYAGIGSRKITPEEERLITMIANKLSHLDIIAYSGNAEGSDIAFQRGSDGKCVLLLPWKKFNHKMYDVGNSLANFDVGNTVEGQNSISTYHPYAANLSYGGRLMMSRNWHQIVGYDIYPKVSFVVCCANEVDGAVQGGTGQACRIAKDMNIPIFNIRNGWDNQKEEFSNLIRKLKNEEKV